jgi:hypothetical protein
LASIYLGRCGNNWVTDVEIGFPSLEDTGQQDGPCSRMLQSVWQERLQQLYIIIIIYYRLVPAYGITEQGYWAKKIYNVTIYTDKRSS